MPTLFSRRPGANRINGGGSQSNGSSRQNESSLSSSAHWAGISNTDFPRLGSPSSEDARPLPPTLTNSFPPERSLSTGNNNNNTGTGGNFLAPQKSIDSAMPRHSGAPSSAGAAAHASSHHLLLPPSSNHSALGMSHAGSAASATKLHHLLAAEHAEPSHSIQYGYTPMPEGVPEFQLELHGVEQVVQLCGNEIKARGIDVPLIFSSMALDLNASNVKSLLANLLTPEFYHSQATSTQAAQVHFGPSFINEVRFANPHDLAALIKWSLTRLGRVFEVPVPVQAKGKVQEEVIFMQQRGFLDLDVYMAWRDEERRSHYALTAFDVFLKNISPQAASLLLTLFSLLSSVTAYSIKNGMTPSKISRLFGVLLFGLPEDESFARTYDAFARGSNATEHLFLSYIRYLSASSSLPTRLTESVKGYPGMLVPELTAPGKQARGVPLTQIERTVRLYSVDLLQSASELEVEPDCVEWTACRGPTEDEPRRPGAGGGPAAGSTAGEPQLSEKYRKLINLRGQAIRKKTGGQNGRAGSESGGSAGGKGGMGIGSRSKNGGPGKIVLNDMDAVTVESYGSLASQQWGDFMSDGFSGTDSSALTFDLRESQRKVRTQAPENRQWSDFATAGFTVNDYGLDNVLNFDDGLKEEMVRWPGERAELNERLRQTQKRLPHFPYDTTPRVVASPSFSAHEGECAPGQGQQHMHPISRMDETFAEVWADYLVGCGWSNRDELTHRNANFVVVQYKSRPIESAVGVQAAAQRSLLDSSRSTNGTRPSSATGIKGSADGGGSAVVDERTDAAWFVIEEIVPAQYRAELEAVGRRKGSSKPMIRKLNLFKKKLAAVGRGEKREKQLPLVSSNYGGGVGSGFTGGSWGSAGAGVHHHDTDDVFRPGPGGSTRVLKLNDPAALPGGGGNSADQSFSTMGSNSTRRTSEDSGGAYAAPGNDSTGSRILSTLRGARSRRTAANTYGGGIGGGGRDSTATPPPPPPPKDGNGGSYDRDGLTTPTPGDFGYRGGKFSPNIGAFGQRQRADSLNSADIETRSFLDPEAELSGGGGSGSKAGGLWRRNPLSRHHHKKSKDDAWVDIMMKDPSSSSGGGGSKGGSGTTTPAAALAASVGLSQSRSRSGSGANNVATGAPSQLVPSAAAAPAAVEPEDDTDLANEEMGRRTPIAGGSASRGQRSPEEYDRMGGAATPTAAASFDPVRRGSAAGASSSSALDGLPPSSSTPMASRTRAAANNVSGLPAPSVGLGVYESGLERDESLVSTSSFGAGAGGSRVTLGVERSPPSEDVSTFAPPIARPSRSPSRNGNGVSSSSPPVNASAEDTSSSALAPPSPNPNTNRHSGTDSSIASFSTSESDLNSRIAQEAAAAAQGRSGSNSGILAPWEVEAQRKRLEQERIQESLRLARSLRDKLRTVEARERSGAGSSSAAGSGTSSEAVESLSIVTGGVGTAGSVLMTPSSSAGRAVSPTATMAAPGANGAAVSPSSSANLATTPTRPVIDPFSKNRTAGRVADIASRFGGPSRAGRTASGSESARSPLGPLSPQGTGSDYGFGGAITAPSMIPAPTGSGLQTSPGSGSGAAHAGAPTSPSPRRSAGREGVSMVESPSQEREVLLDDAGAGAGSPLVSAAVTAGGVPIQVGSSADSDAPSRSSMDNGNFTDADSIYPDDAASNYSRDTSHTDEDGLGSLQQQQQRAWNYTNALKKQGLSGVGSAGLGSGGPSGSGGLASTFPGDAGRSEDEDMSMPMPAYVFREPYQPGMPLDNVTEETESVISGVSGSNV
ncbi:hypothetical protein A4X13_0g5864 [Tilletia indica]|uniref:Meiotically up-regulated protein Msb1/Mug8 domain-containing protein n=1 Tax=Tilletia indica TaxID=43049 RepID=A0A177T7G0_9BASI|nr:hypothetical protein A4X13_0g5864 [Tilletia indica]